MHQKWVLVITLVNAVAVPTMAFLIRMFQGEVRNENELIISDFLRMLFKDFLNRKQSPS